MQAAPAGRRALVTGSYQGIGLAIAEALAAEECHLVLHGIASFEEEPPDQAEMARRMAEVRGRGLPYLVAEDSPGSGAILGYAYAGPYRARPAYRYSLEDSVYVVPGKGGRGISKARAFEHVYGYTIVNDVTARTLQQRHKQWFIGKSTDGFCPMGPVLVTADELTDPQGLAISLRVNGQLRQSSHTSKMIFPVAQCIEVLSQGMTLLPGDVIATGTPEGVGAATGNFLKAGDRIEAEIEQIGVLNSKVVRP